MGWGFKCLTELTRAVVRRNHEVSVASTEQQEGFSDETAAKSINEAASSRMLEGVAQVSTDLQYARAAQCCPQGITGHYSRCSAPCSPSPNHCGSITRIHCRRVLLLRGPQALCMRSEHLASPGLDPGSICMAWPDAQCTAVRHCCPLRPAINEEGKHGQQ